MIKYCPHCQKDKEFHESGKTGRCKDCQNEYSRANRGSETSQGRLTRNRRRGGNRAMMRELINGYKESKGCKDCRSMHPHYLLDFDHLEGSGKIASISKMITNEASVFRIMLEIKKCEVVCKMCHATRTHNRRT